MKKTSIFTVFGTLLCNMTMEMNNDKGIKSTKTMFDIVEILHTFDSARLTDITDATGYAKSTVHDHLTTLINIGYVVREDAEYRLSLKFLDLGSVAKRQYQDLIEAATPVIHQLVDETSETVSLVVEEYGEAVYLERVSGERGVPTDSWVGRRKPIHTISAGKAILAYLPSDHFSRIINTHGLDAATKHTITDQVALWEECENIREEGVAFNNRESHERIRAVGAPILVNDEIEGAVSVAGPYNRLTGDLFNIELPRLLKGGTNEVELKLAYSDN